MNKIITIGLIALTLTGCCCGLGPKVRSRGSGWHQMINDEHLSKIIYDHAVQMKYLKHLRFEDAQCCYDEKLTKIRLDFSTQEILEMCEARHLLVDVVEGFLEKINNDPEVRSMMATYPFTANQLEVIIDFQSYFGLYVDPLYIGWIRLYNGVSYFYAFDNKERDRDEWKHRSEYYYKSKLFTEAERAAEDKYREELSTPQKSTLPPSIFETF